MSDMYDLDGNYIPGFGTQVRITKPKIKPQKNEKQVLTWNDFTEYEWVYLPDDNLPAYELRKIIHTIEK